MASVLCVGTKPHVQRAAELLASEGMRVSSVRGLEDAASAVEEDPPDCVVVALSVPGGSGPDLVEDVGDRVPIVVCPADGSESIAGEAIAAGAAGYVPAAEASAVLADRVQQLVSDREPRRYETVDAGGVAGRDSGQSEFDSADGAFEQLFAQAPLAIVEWTEECEIAGWNAAAEDLFGFSKDEAIGASPEIFLPEIEREHAREVARKVFDGESVRAVNDNRTANGDRITCRWHNAPLVEDGEVTGALSFAQDVTEEVRRTETLEALHWATSDLLKATDRTEIAEKVVTAAEGVLGAEFAAVHFHDDGEFDPVATTGAPQSAAPDLAGTELATAYERGHPMGVDRLARSSVDGDPLPVESLECHPLGDHGLLCFGVDEPGGIDGWTAKLGALLAATAEAALDRARRERDLRRASTIVEAVGDGIYALDPDGEIVTVNDSMAEITGYDRADLEGSNIRSFVPEETVRRGTEIVRDLLETDPAGVRTEELVFETDDGRRVHCEVTLSLLYADGEYEGSVGIVRDVTERKLMQRTLQDRTEKIEGLHETAQRLEASRDATEIFETAVEAARDVLGFDRTSIAQHTDGKVYTRAAAHEAGLDLPSDANERSETTSEAFETGETIVVSDIQASSYECPLPSEYRSGLMVPFGEEYLFRAASKGADAFEGTDVDLAELLIAHVAEALERVEYERDLRAERDRFATLFESVPDPVVRTRVEGDQSVVLDANPAFECVFGYDAREIRGEFLEDHIVPPGQTERAHELTRRGADGDLVETEVERMTTTGLRDFLLTVVPIETGDGDTVTYAVYTDITERKQRRQRLEVLNRVLRHDLRNGMNIVQGGAEALADRVDDEGARQHVETIEERAGELIDLAEKTRVIEQTLARDPEEVGPVDVVDLVETAVDRYGDDAEFDVDLPDSAVARADDLLGVAVRHVVQNAIVHHDGDPSIEIEVGSVDGSNAVEVVVADDGPGIPDDERELVTEQREITQLRHASGLGLWLVNWVVTGAGGDLEIEDDEPRGTVVRMVLPGSTVDAHGTASTEGSQSQPTD